METLGHSQKPHDEHPQPRPASAAEAHHLKGSDLLKRVVTLTFAVGTRLANGSDGWRRFDTLTAVDEHYS
jgi:hypothetical protein